MIKKKIWYYHKSYSNYIFENHIFVFFFLVHSKEENGVLAHMLLIFRFRSTEDPETINKNIQRVLHEKLQDAVGPPNLYPESIEIKSKFI